jgi:lysophospholipase L1-like esterase
MNIPRSCIPCEKIENDAYDWYARHAAKLEEVKTKRADIVFIGDSITHFWNCEEGITYGEEVWKEFYGSRAVLNLGFGYDRTQNMLWRLEHGEMANQSPKVIVVNAGTNNFSCTKNYDGDTPEAAFKGVKKLVETLRTLAPEAKIILMGVFPRMPEEKRLLVLELNKLLKEYVGDSSDKKLSFLDLTEKFLYPDGSFNHDLFQDRCCHPNNAGYRIWANALEPEISACCGGR